MSVAAVAKSSVKAVARAIDRLHPPVPGIVVLIYHRVGATRGGEMTLTPAVFERQVAHLALTHRLLSIDQAAVELSSTDPAPLEPGVVVSFDDGSADWIDVVLPILSAHAVPAVWYVTSGFVEAGRLPDGEPAASWSGLAEAAGSPLITLGCHTHSHRLLDRLAPALIDDELDRSIDLIASGTGSRPQHFAYPKAVAPSSVAEDSVRARFRTAVLAGTRPNRPGADLFRLARSPIQASDTTTTFTAKVDGGMWWEDAVRSTANRLRYRGVAE